MKLPVAPPVSPMLAKSADSLPSADAGDFWFEPKWDGFRALIFRDGSELEIYSRNERPLTRYFPELWGVLRTRLPERCVLDGELVVPAKDGKRLDFDALSARIHPASSRIKLLSTETPARFAVFDILALGDRDLRGRPFAERRSTLEKVAAGFRPPIHLTPSTTNRSTASDWFRRFEGAGFDGIIIKPADGAYLDGERAQFKLKHQKTAEVVAAGYRVHKNGDGPGSLLLGLYDEDGLLNYVGAAGGFSKAVRGELADFLEPFRLSESFPRRGDHPEHPWLREPAAGAVGRRPGAPNRWRGAEGDADWVPIWGAPAAEVTYDAITAGRFRHISRLLRWRRDRPPESCTYAQLQQAPPVELEEIFSERIPLAAEGR